MAVAWILLGTLGCTTCPKIAEDESAAIPGTVNSRSFATAFNARTAGRRLRFALPPSGTLAAVLLLGLLAGFDGGGDVTSPIVR